MKKLVRYLKVGFLMSAMLLFNVNSSKADITPVVNASLSFTPATVPTKAVGDSDFTITASVSPGGNTTIDGVTGHGGINGVLLDITFQPSVVTLVSVTAKNSFGFVVAPIAADYTAANASGTFSTGIYKTGTGVVAATDVADFVFHVQGSGVNSPINFASTANATVNDGAGTEVVPSGSGRTGAIVTVTAPDATAPIVTAFTLPALTNATIPISSFTATDATGVTAWMVKETATNSAPVAPVSGDSGWLTSGITGSAPYAITGNIIASTAGTRYFWAYAKDAAGNVSAASTSATVNIDMTAPTVSITAPANGSITSNSTPTLTYTVSDGTVVVKVDSNVVSKVSGDTLSVLSDGSHTVTVEATDAASNVGTLTNTFIVDAGAPIIGNMPGNTPNDGVSATMVDSDVINYTVSDLATATTQFYGFSSDSVCNASDTIAIPFTSGVNFIINTDHVDYLCLKAIDAAGNITYHLAGQLNINSAPMILNVLPVGSLPAGTVQANVTFNTSEAGICRYATSANVTFNSMTNIIDTALSITHSFAVSGLANGNNYTYYVRCQDASLMANSYDQVISFSVANPVIVPAVDNNDSGHSDKNKSTPSRSVTNSKKTVKMGDILTQRGKKFTKNGFVMLYFAKAGGGYYAPQKVKTSSSGAFVVTYKVNKPKGKYGWYAVDVKTGRKSKTVYYTIK